MCGTSLLFLKCNKNHVGAAHGGDFGCTSLPDKEKDFKANLQRTMEFAKALNCKK